MAHYENEKRLSAPASTDLSASQYCFVTRDSNGKLAVAADGGADAIGVLQNAPDAADKAGGFSVSGVTKVKAGGSFSAGDRVSCDNAGKAVAVGTGETALGEAVEAGADGRIVSVQLLL